MCDIDRGNQTQFGSAYVVVSICKSTTNRAVGQFRFAQPRVYSVSPLYGPAAGGTIVRVRGADLNIGNRERTTVSLVATDSTGRRKTTSCDIT